MLQIFQSFLWTVALPDTFKDLDNCAFTKFCFIGQHFEKGDKSNTVINICLSEAFLFNTFIAPIK